MSRAPVDKTAPKLAGFSAGRLSSRSWMAPRKRLVQARQTLCDQCTFRSLELHMPLDLKLLCRAAACRRTVLTLVDSTCRPPASCSASLPTNHGLHTWQQVAADVCLRCHACTLLSRRSSARSLYTELGWPIRSVNYICFRPHVRCENPQHIMDAYVHLMEHH